MERRRYGTNPLLESRAEGEEKVDKKIRYQQIIEILSEHTEGMTAKEIAVEMYKRKYTPTTERNFSAPRISEMLKFGLLDCVGKKKCKFTKVNVGVFTLRKNVDVFKLREGVLNGNKG